MHPMTPHTIDDRCNASAPPPQHLQDWSFPLYGYVLTCHWFQHLATTKSVCPMLDIFVANSMKTCLHAESAKCQRQTHLTSSEKILKKYFLILFIHEVLTLWLFGQEFQSPGSHRTVAQQQLLIAWLSLNASLMSGCHVGVNSHSSSTMSEQRYTERRHVIKIRFT